ncbi:MAG: hypothetical protein Q8L68_03995 [Methylococcales bacterium]|nr:hypothetical protein [Methylococcales bacterium]
MEWECELTAEGNLQYVYTIQSFKGNFMHDESYKMRSKAYMSHETALEVIDDFVENYSGTTKNDWYLLGYALCKKYN